MVRLARSAVLDWAASRMAGLEVNLARASGTATVVAWHRRGLVVVNRRSGAAVVRRPSAEIRRLYPEMAVANPLWGASRIHGELLTLGFEVSD